jgi:hypothetical protein
MGAAAVQFYDVFVAVGIIAVLVVLGLTHGFFIPRARKIAELAERDVAAAGSGEVKLSDEFSQAVTSTAIVGNLAALVVLVTLFSMSVKPFI